MLWNCLPNTLDATVWAGAAAVASSLAAVLTEIYLSTVCSACREILRRHGRGQPL
eukprot:COSAG01_NODE_783_length_13630_cov_5.556459_22_plen_55_part_00